MARGRVKGRPYRFAGARIAASDKLACMVESPSFPFYCCSRVKRHPGDHIACVFSESTDEPSRTVAQWPRREEPKW
jgi:hypothetical protein